MNYINATVAGEIYGMEVKHREYYSRALQRMTERKRWLPGVEVQKRIREWARE